MLILNIDKIECSANNLQDKKAARKAKRLEKEQKAAAKGGKANGGAVSVGQPEPAASGVESTSTGNVKQRALHASVEEADDE